MCALFLFLQCRQTETNSADKYSRLSLFGRHNISQTDRSVRNQKWLMTYFYGWLNLVWPVDCSLKNNILCCLQNLSTLALNFTFWEPFFDLIKYHRGENRIIRRMGNKNAWFGWYSKDTVYLFLFLAKTRQVLYRLVTVPSEWKHLVRTGLEI